MKIEQPKTTPGPIRWFTVKEIHISNFLFKIYPKNPNLKSSLLQSFKQRSYSIIHFVRQSVTLCGGNVIFSAPKQNRQLKVIWNAKSIPIFSSFCEFSIPFQDRGLKFSELINYRFYLFSRSFDKICPLIGVLDQFLNFQVFVIFSNPIQDW